VSFSAGGSITVTIVNSIITGKTADAGGGLSVYTTGILNVYGTTFSSNTAVSSISSSHDIIKGQGTVTVYGYAAGYYGGTQGSALGTYSNPSYGTIGGSLYSYSGCMACAR